MYRKSMSDSHPIADYRKRQVPPLTQDDLGDLIGVDGMTVSRWERGENPPRGKNLKKIQELTGLSLADILSANVERAQ